MLGYVVPYKPEMKVKEAELYKSYYCGICKSIGERYGHVPRTVLSYDAAFLAIMLDSVFDEEEYFTKEKCIANPFKKKIIASSDAIDFAGSMMLVLAWHKLLDDAYDEDKLSAKIMSKFMASKYEEICSSRPDFCYRIEDRLEELHKLEKDRCDNLDKISDLFAKIMEDIFIEGTITVSKAHAMEAIYEELAYDDTDSDITREGVLSNAKIMGRIGYHLGKWIYLMDAYDDIAENIETGAYNPLIYRFDYRDGEDVHCFKMRIREDVERNLLIYLGEIGKCVDLMDIKKNKGIIDNIVFIGLLKRTEELLRGGKGKDEQSI